MNAVKPIFLSLAVLAMTGTLVASGPIGIYAIIEKVVIEPEQPGVYEARAKIWGAFAFVDGAAGGLAISDAKRGYLYFTAPYPFPGTNKQVPAAELREWNDLKAVAGTGQAVAFGRWSYSGRFEALQLQEQPHVFERGTDGVMRQTDLMVRSESEPPGRPTIYQTNSGVVKLSEQGSHAEIVKLLKASLKK